MSREAVENLKKNWTHDPCWDLAETEGFEEHREELAEFQRAYEAQFTDMDKQAEELAKRCDIHLDIATLLLLMNRRIRDLEDILYVPGDEEDGGPE